MEGEDVDGRVEEGGTIIDGRMDERGGDAGMDEAGELLIRLLLGLVIEFAGDLPWDFACRWSVGDLANALEA